MSAIERFAGNTFYLFLEWVSSTVLAFLFWVIIWKTLPPESAGVISTSINIIVLLSGIAIFGMTNTLTKLISEYSRERREGKIKSLVGFSNRILLTISILMGLGFVSFVVFSGIDLKIPIFALVLITLGIFMRPILDSTSSILSGLQNMRLVFKTNMASNLVKAVLSAVLIFLGWGAAGPLAALIVSFAVFLVLRRDIIALGFRAKSLVNRNYVIAKYMLPAFLGTVGWLFFQNTPVIILTLVNDLHSSGIFSAALSMSQPLTFVSLIMSGALFPIVSGLMVGRGHARLQANLVKSVIRYSTFVTLPLIALYIFFSKGFVLVFANLSYLESVQYLPVVGIATVLLGFGWIFTTGLYAIRRTEASRNVVIATAAVFLVLSIPLTIMQGTWGMVEAYLASIVVLVGLSYLVLRRNLKFEVPWSSIGKIAMASVALFLILLPSEIFGLKLLERLPLLILGVVVYLAILLVSKFYDKQDIELLRYMKKKAPRMARQIDSVLNLLAKYSDKESKF